MFYNLNVFKKISMCRHIPISLGKLLEVGICLHTKRKAKLMSITSDIIRGHTETIILASLMEHDSYGYQINKDILRKTDNRYELKEATLYTAFRRLEQAGYITTYWGDEKVGARRRYYSITPKGRKAYEQGLREWNEAKVMIDKLLELDQCGENS